MKQPAHSIAILLLTAFCLFFTINRIASADDIIFYYIPSVRQINATFGYPVESDIYPNKDVYFRFTSANRSEQDLLTFCSKLVRDKGQIDHFL